MMGVRLGVIHNFQSRRIESIRKLSLLTYSLMLAPLLLTTKRQRKKYASRSESWSHFFLAVPFSHTFARIASSIGVRDADAVVAMAEACRVSDEACRKRSI